MKSWIHSPKWTIEFITILSKIDSIWAESAGEIVGESGKNYPRHLKTRGIMQTSLL